MFFLRTQDCASLRGPLWLFIQCCVALPMWKLDPTHWYPGPRTPPPTLVGSDIPGRIQMN